MSKETRRVFLGGLTGLAGVAGITAGGLDTQVSGARVLRDITEKGGVDSTKFWSKPINGIRARLVATKTEFTHTQPASLMMFQNVSDKPVQLPGGVRVMPMLTPKNDHPYGKKHDYNAAVWMTQPNTEVHILWALQAQVRLLHQEIIIGPGDLYMAIINIKPHQEQELMKEMRAADLPNDIQRDTARLAYRGLGKYVLEAVWNPAGLAKKNGVQKDLEQWKGKQIVFPPIEVLIVKERKKGAGGDAEVEGEAG